MGDGVVIEDVGGVVVGVVVGGGVGWCVVVV